MSTRSRLIPWLLVTLSGAACVSEPPPGELDLAAATPFKAMLKRGILTITGNGESSRLALRLRAGASSTLEVDVRDDGSADFSFDRARIDQIVIDAGGGDDFVRMDESNGAFSTEEQITIGGGAGNDTLLGGAGAETFYGGGGDDLVTPGRGNDVVFLGDGNDSVVWNPGDGSDVVDGEGGSDVMVFNDANVAERVDFIADAGRLRMTRDIGLVTMDVDGVERVDLHARGGADSVFVNDLAGTAVTRVNVDLSADGAGAGDGLPDTVTVNGSPASVLAIGPEGGAVVATGLAAAVAVTGGEPALDKLVANGGASLDVKGSDAADTMQISFSATGARDVLVSGFNVVAEATSITRLALFGLGGDDTILAQHGSTAPLQLDGGDGNDTIVGGDGNDFLFGGPGNDTLNGAIGADTAFLGDGDDTFIWNPGEGSDVVEGQAGHDTLVFFGSNAAEELDLDPNGPRLRLFRNVGSITMDVAGVEDVDLGARAGADAVVVSDLAGTGVTRVNVDLALATGGPDAVADTVIVSGPAGAASMDVAAEGGAVVARGAAAAVAVTGGDSGLDTLVVNGGGVLDVNGSDAADNMVVFAAGGHTLVSAAGFNVLVQAGATGKLAVNGLGGDDSIQGQGLATLPLQLDGGEGNDLIIGSAGVDRLLGGPGNDTIDGGQGSDVALLGPGDDTFIWNPGGANDVVEGEDGADLLLFNGANIDERVELDAVGDRLRFSRDIATVSMDVGGVERVDFNARAGSDQVIISDLTGTPVTQVNVDLAALPGTATGDALADRVIVLGSPAADAIAVGNDAGTALVTGLATSVRVSHPDAIDTLVVNGEGGVDTFTVDPALAGLIQVSTSQD